MFANRPGLPYKTIDMVQDFLDTFPNSMNFEQLDGFFCALICSPEEVPFSEFLPLVFGPGAPTSQSPEQTKEAMNAIVAHWNHIAEELSAGDKHYPFLFADQDDKCSANEWADAFLYGVQLREEAWSDLLNEKSENPLLLPIVRLREELTDVRQGRGFTITSEEREQLVSQLVDNLLIMYKRNILGQ